MRRLVLALALVLSTSLVSPTTAHAVPGGYRQQATAIAHTIGCTNIREKLGPVVHTHSSLLCNLKGRRVYILTFKNAYEQRLWIRAVDDDYRRDNAFIATKRGMIAIAPNANRRTARIAATALRADVRRLSD